MAFRSGGGRSIQLSYGRAMCEPTSYSSSWICATVGWPDPRFESSEYYHDSGRMGRCRSIDATMGSSASPASSCLSSTPNTLLDLQTAGPRYRVVGRDPVRGEVLIQGGTLFLPVHRGSPEWRWARRQPCEDRLD